VLTPDRLNIGLEPNYGNNWLHPPLKYIIYINQVFASFTSSISLKIMTENISELHRLRHQTQSDNLRFMLINVKVFLVRSGLVTV